MPRERARIATWLVGLPRRSTGRHRPNPSPRSEKAGCHRPPRWRRRARPARIAPQASQHAIAQVAQIGAAGAKIRITSLIIGSDFRINRGAPGCRRRLAARNGRKGRRCERCIIKQRELQSENRLGVGIIEFGGQRGQRLLGRRQRAGKRRLRLGDRLLCRGDRGDLGEAHEGPHGDTRRGRPSPEPTGLDANAHPGNLLQPA